MKKAIQRFIRDDKGNAKVVLIDAQTLQPVLNPAEYEVLNQTQLPYWEPVQDVATPDVPSKVQPPAPVLNQYIQQADGDPTAQTVNAAVQTHAVQSGSVGAKPASVGVQPSSSATSVPVTQADIVKAETSAPAVHPSVTGTSVQPSVNPSVQPSTNPSVAPQATTERAKGLAGVTKAQNTQGFDMVDNFRARLSSVDFDKLDLDPVAKEKAKEFQAAAKAKGLDLAVDVKDMVRTPERQKAIKASGFSQTLNSEHVAAMGLDISPVDVNDQKGWEAKRSLAKETGWNQLNPSWDPAHMGLTDTLGISPKQAIKDKNYFGNVPVSQEQRKALGLQPDTGIPQTRPEVSKGIIGQAKSGIVGDPSKVSPAQMAGMGLMTHPRTPDQISRMAAAFAGELSPQQLDALAAGDETARKELAGMVSTAENRASKAKDFDAVFDPSQYNSMMEKNAGVTKGNYAKYGSTLRDAIARFYTGDLKPESYDPTSYYNPDISDPAWGSKNKGRFGLMGAMDVGEHRFGSVADRSYKTTDLSGSADRPSEGSRFGIGGLGRGLDSPSESGGARFGGQGLAGNTSGREGTTSGPGLGLGGRSTASKNTPSKNDKDKDRSANGRSVGPSGGSKSWGGPR